MVYLARLGYRVVGVDGVRKAIEDFAKDRMQRSGTSIGVRPWSGDERCRWKRSACVTSQFQSPSSKNAIDRTEGKRECE